MPDGKVATTNLNSSYGVCYLVSKKANETVVTKLCQKIKIKKKNSNIKYSQYTDAELFPL